MAEINTVIAEASQDLQTIEDFVNLPADSEVYPRLLPSVNVGTLSGIRDAIFEAGGLPATPFATKALMTASALADGQLAMVYNETANNGLYVKKSGAWVKSSYDVVSQTELNESKIIAANLVDDLRDSLLTRSDNMFDADSSAIGKTISDTGAISVNAAYSLSDYIAVKPNTTYTLSSNKGSTGGGAAPLSAAAFVATYDKDKVFIRRLTTTADETASKSFTTDGDVYYIRMIMNQGLPTEHNRMLNIGATALPYVEYKKELAGDVALSDAEVAKIVAKIDITDTAKPYISESYNILDVDSAIIGKAVDPTGELYDFNGYSVSQPIAVVAEQQYTLSGEIGFDAAVVVSFYDSDMVFIRRYDSRTSEAGFVTFQTAPDSAYLRLSMNQGLPTEHNRMLVKGTDVKPYKPYGAKLQNISLSDDMVSDIAEKVVGKDNDTAKGYIKATPNLFDYKKALTGRYIDGTGAIITDGVAKDYAISDFIPVVAGDKYTISSSVNDAFTTTAYYDANKVFITRAYTRNSTQPNNALTITIPANTAFLRFSLNQGLPSENERMFNKGDVALPYQEARVELTGLAIAQDVMQQINREIRPNPVDRVMVDLPVDGTFSTTKTWAEYTDFRNTTSAQVYAMYDALMAAHPSYITKQALGNDAWGNEIALYKCTPKRPPATAKLNIKHPKIFITCGTHGMEHMPPLTTYLMLYEMCNHWNEDPLLEALRFNVEFLIIPVVNPTGWNKYSRVNDNGVDINRNFPEGWKLQGEGTSLYGGASPLSELESQYVSRVFDENPDIDAFYDFHNFNGYDDGNFEYLIWIPTGSGQYHEHMGQILISRMTRKWRKEYDWIPRDDSWFAGKTTNEHGAMIQDHATGRGIKFSSTFEVGGRWWIDPTGQPYDTNHKRTCVEAFVNWLLINLQELKRL